jgi:hypothetical protein
MIVSLTEEQWSTYSGDASNSGGQARRGFVTEHGKVPLESTTQSSSMPSRSQPQQMKAQHPQQQPQQQTGAERNFAAPSFGNAPPR